MTSITPTVRFLVLTCLLSASASAQVAATFNDYRFDSTFVIGGYDVNRSHLIREVKDSLGFSFIAFYGAPTILTPAAISAALARADSGALRMRTMIDDNDTAASPVTFLFTPGMTGTMAKRATNVESYPGNDYTKVQVSTFQVRSHGTEASELFLRQYIYGWSVNHRALVTSIANRVPERRRGALAIGRAVMQVGVQVSVGPHARTALASADRLFFDYWHCSDPEPMWS